MRQSHRHRSLGILIASAAVLLVALLMLSAVAAAGQPAKAKEAEPVPSGSLALPPLGRLALQAPPAVQASPAVQTPAKDADGSNPGTWRRRTRPGQPRSRFSAEELQAAAAGAVTIQKTVSTGSGDDTIVYNGDRVTYTLSIRNNGGSPATNIIVYDPLPGAVDGATLNCVGVCSEVVELEQIPTPLGGMTSVSRTVELTWSIESLPPSGVVQRVFSARVVGQPEGAIIRNTAELEYDEGIAISNEAQTRVLVRVEADGQGTVADVPTWVSSDLGGTMSLDWGDFDGDGYLDLALGSTVGTSVYRNQGGQLDWCWGNGEYTLGVRWADVNGDGDLELVAVGKSDDNSALSPGTNYVFDLAADCTTVATTPLASAYQLLRVEPGDYNSDGAIDLIASTNAIDPYCPVVAFLKSGDPFGFDYVGCVSFEATAGLGAADYDNSGDLDLALGMFPNGTHLARNDISGSLFSPPRPSQVEMPFLGGYFATIDQSTGFLPYDFSWGDYDRDGYLDLAAAYPLDRLVRIYRNQSGTGFQHVYDLRTSLFRTPQALDWGDFNGDGYLDLAVADAPPKIFYSDQGSFSNSDFLALPPEAAEGQIWALAAADADNDGDLDLALGNWKGASLLYTAFDPFLDTALTPVDSAWAASSVAWGDTIGAGGYQDLLFGSGGRTVYARLYPNNNEGAFPSSVQLDSRYGPHDVAFGDVDRDGKLDVALGSIWLGDRIYLAKDRPTTGEWKSSYALSSSSYSVAWADVEGDGDLDLLVGGDGPERLYVNGGTALATSPFWSSTLNDDTRSVAWGDYDGDGYLDFAAGNEGGPTRLYHNNKDCTFSLAWNSGVARPTRSLAWADYDGDGDMDLAVGNYGQPNYIYENQGGALGSTPIWGSEVASNTTALAWGDWNNDGDLDLAVGNDGEPDQVYGNQSSAPGSPRFLWLWTSAASLKTSDLAWGDRDGDGDLDLALSQTGTGQNGYYENGYVLPVHLLGTRGQPLPHSPSYLAIERPGTVPDAYLYSTWELLGYGVPPTDAVVPIDYTLYDPEGDSIVSQDYQYSLDGGGTWHEAGLSTDTVSLNSTGVPSSFDWDAQAVEALSDDARFRITIVHQNPVGPVQRASTSALSPPFRVRGTDCVWPVGPSFTFFPDPLAPGDEVTFEGEVLVGDGPLAFTWDFGDGTTGTGQVVRHTYQTVGLFLVRMTVATMATGCPDREVRVSRIVRAGEGTLVYLPMVTRSATISAAQQAVPLRALAAGNGSGADVGYKIDPKSINAQGAAPPAGGVAAVAMPAASAGAPASTGAGSPAIGAVAGDSVFPGGVFTSTASEVVAVTENLPGIQGQPSIAGAGETIAFWSTPPEEEPVRPDHVIISEVDPGDPDAVEFYNPTDAAVVMDGWVFTAIQSTGPTPYTFPPFTLDPGAYVVVHEGSGTDTATDLYMVSQLYYWVNGGSGAASLVDVGGLGVDFVRWGSSSEPPPPGTAWISPNPPSPAPYQSTLGRDQSLVDTDAGLDWCTQADSLGIGNPPCEYDPGGNIEVCLAEDLEAATPSWKQVTFSTGNILGGFNLWPSINISGTRIAFFSDRNLTGQNADENFEIFAYDRTQADPFTQITHSEGGVNIWPSTDVTGTRIVFASDRDLDPGRNADKNQEIFLAELSAGGGVSITQITTTTSPIINDEPSISGDGRTIAYARYGQTGFADLYLYDGAHNIPLPQQEGTNVQPSLNYSGTHLAFVSTGNLLGGNWNPDKSREIFVAEADGGGGWTYTQITSATTGFVNDQPSLSADGIRLAFVSGSDVWLYDDYGAPKAVLLSDQGGSNSRPKISDNGLYVAFASNNEIVRAFIPLTDLVAKKRVEPNGVVVPGEPITYTFTFSNQGLDDIEDAEVYDAIPTEVLDPQWACSPPGCTKPANGQHILNLVVDLAPGATLAYTVNGTVDPSATGTITNTAIVTPPGQISDQKPLNNRSTVTNTLAPEADLVLTKSVDRDPIAAGETLVYTLTLTNDGGPSDAWGLVITDRLPYGVSYVDMLSGPDPIQVGGLLTWTISSLAVDGSDQLVFQAAVASWLTSPTITNTAGITSASQDLDLSDNWVALPTEVTTTADLAIAKTAWPDPVLAGATLTYTLAYTNAGPSDAQEVYITDTLPLSVTWDGTVLVEAPPLSGPTQIGASEQWYWYTPTLPAGASGAITFVVTVSDALAAPETITNTAVISSATSEDLPGDNDAHAPVDVLIPVDLAVLKIAQPNPIDAGEDITYTIVVSNLASVTATNATVFDNIPEDDINNFTWTCQATPGSTCTASSAKANDDIDDTVTIAPAGLLTYTVIGELKASAPSQVVNTATVTVAAGFTDPNPLDNSDTFTSTVTTSADLQVSKSVSDPAPDFGDTIVYTLTISNPDGPSNARNVVLTDVLPLEVGYVSHSGGTYTPASGRWDVGTVQVGANHTKHLYVTVNVTDTAAILIPNVTDGLRSDAYDPDPTNNTGRVTITVNLPPVVNDQTFSVAENSPNGTSVGTVLATDPNAGDTLTYTITAHDPVPAFAIDAASGEITVTDSAALDYETNPTFDLTVEVEDPRGLTDDASVTINLTDVNETPTVTITQPISGTVFGEGESVGFAGTATDPEEGDLSSSLSWQSSLDGAIGIGASFSHSGLSIGAHVITATVTDTGGKGASDTVAITITAVSPDITVTKEATPTNPLEPGGTITFTVVITNNTTEPVTLTVLTDDVYGDLDGQGDCATDGLIAGNAAYQCAFTATVTGDPAFSQTDVVTATVQDDEANEDTETDSATVTIQDIQPSITVTKTADPASVPETGGTVTFAIEVANDTVEPVTLTLLTDDIYGDLNGQGDCATGALILGNAAYQCSFTATVSGDHGVNQTDVVTATVQDDEANEDTETDSATVVFTDVQPDVTVRKTASSVQVLEPLGTVTYTVEITNNTAETVILTSLSDDLKGDLDGDGTCETPQTIAGNLSYTCTFTRTVSGSAGESDTDTVTATLGDDEQNQVTPAGSATVDIVPFLLAITGPTTSQVNATDTFTATVSPTASLPITYTWQATGYSAQPHTLLNRLTDTISYTWGASGPKTVTVTASCLSGTVTAVHHLTVDPLLRAMPATSFAGFRIYLPLVLKVPPP